MTIPSTKYLYEPQPGLWSLSLFISKHRIVLPTLPTLALLFLTALTLLLSTQQLLLNHPNSPYSSNTWGRSITRNPIYQITASAIGHTQTHIQQVHSHTQTFTPLHRVNLYSTFYASRCMPFDTWVAAYTHGSFTKRCDTTVASKLITPLTLHDLQIEYANNNTDKNDNTESGDYRLHPWTQYVADNTILHANVLMNPHDLFYPQKAAAEADSTPPTTQVTTHLLDDLPFPIESLPQTLPELLCAVFSPDGGFFGLCENSYRELYEFDFPVNPAEVNHFGAQHKLTNTSITRRMTSGDHQQLQQQHIITDHTTLSTNQPMTTKNTPATVLNQAQFVLSHFTGLLQRLLTTQWHYMTTSIKIIHHTLYTHTFYYKTAIHVVLYTHHQFTTPIAYITYYYLTQFLDEVVLKQYNHVLVMFVVLLVGMVLGSLCSLKPLYDHADVVVPYDQYQIVLSHQQQQEQQNNNDEQQQRVPQQRHSSSVTVAPAEKKNNKTHPTLQQPGPTSTTAVVSPKQGPAGIA